MVGLDDEGSPVSEKSEETVKTSVEGLKAGDVVILESSVPPNTTLSLINTLLDKFSGLEAEENFYSEYSPERFYVGRALQANS